LAPQLFWGNWVPFGAFFPRAKANVEKTPPKTPLFKKHFFHFPHLLGFTNFQSHEQTNFLLKGLYNLGNFFGPSPTISKRGRNNQQFFPLSPPAERNFFPPTIFIGPQNFQKTFSFQIPLGNFSRANNSIFPPNFQGAKQFGGGFPILGFSKGHKSFPRGKRAN